MIARDADTVVTVGHHAIDTVAAALPSAYDRFHILNTALESLPASAGVAEFGDHLIRHCIPFG
jgi:hypothetical protein